MRKKCQKAVVLSLLISNIFSLSSTSVMAKSEKDDKNISVEDYRVNNISINSNQALKLFEDLGYSDKEIVELYQNDSNSLQVTIKLPEKLFKRTGIQCVKLETTMLRSFPSNPKPGQTYIQRYDVNYEEAFRHAGLIGYGVTGISEAIAKYSPSTIIKAIAVAIGAGAFAVTLSQQIYYNNKIDQGYIGVRGGATYKWVWNNDMIYDWIYSQGSSWREYY